MLVHHFGSREGLLVEVIRAVEARQRAVLAELARNGGEEPAAREMRFWEHLRSPELAPQERLFFEVYGQALQGRPWARPLLDVLATGDDREVDAAMDCFLEMMSAHLGGLASPPPLTDGGPLAPQASGPAHERHTTTAD
jgi:AcrR family transcriptional regulator